MIASHITIKLALFSAVSFTLFLFVSRPFHQPLHVPPLHGGVDAATCSPEDWSAGRWVRKPNPKPVVVADDVYDVSGFLGCASNREVGWHLSNEHDIDFPWRGNVSAYDWVAGHRCVVPTDYREAMVVDMVQNGGWLLIGDSVTQEHFFSISCTLYPHVLATPDYSSGGEFDRAWPQHLYLNPKSSLLSSIHMPQGFDIATTPLLTFRRNDLLFNLTEIEAIHNGGGYRPGFNESTKLFGDEGSWTISPSEYFHIFLDPLPGTNYQALIVSTAGHWSLKLFEGLQGGYPEIFDLFRLVVTEWVYQAGRYLDSPLAKGRLKEVIVRPYLPGDDNCHSDLIQNGGPTDEPLNNRWASYNWEWIPYLNAAFEEAVRERDHPHIHYLAIERPGRLRPDAHVTAGGDCMHWTVGAGVIENWTQYIQYYLTTYLTNHRQDRPRVGRPAPYD